MGVPGAAATAAAAAVAARSHDGSRIIAARHLRNVAEMVATMLPHFGA